MRNTILICLFLSIQLLCYAQKINVDSLLQVVQANKKDTNEVKAYCKLAKNYLLHEVDTVKGFLYVKKIEDLSIKLGYDAGLLESYLNLGNYYRQQDDWARSMEFNNKIINYKYKHRDSILERSSKMKAYNNLAYVYSTNGDIAGSLESHLIALGYCEKYFPTDSTSLLVTKINVANDYTRLNEFEKADDYLKSASTVLNGVRSPYFRYQYWSQYNVVYSHTKNVSGVLKTIKEIENIYNKESLSKRQALEINYDILSMKGELNRDFQKDYKKSITNYSLALNEIEKLGETNYILSAKYELGKTYQLAGNNNIAQPILKEVFDSSFSSGLPEYIYNSAFLLATIYEQKGDFEKANFYLRHAKYLKDSITNDEKLKQLYVTEIRYQTEKKIKEIESLKLLNAEKEVAVLQKNRWLLGIASGAVILLLLTAGIYKNSRQKQKIAQQENNLQKEQIKFYEKQQQVISLQSMINGQEIERTRIAKDLHDSLGGTFSTLKMYFGTLQHEEPNLKDNELFNKSYQFINTASDEVRRIAHNMMPEVLMKLGLVHAVQDLCNNINAGKLLQVFVQAYGMNKRLAASTEIMLYRIIQELLNNIMKHSMATEAIVQFNRMGNKLNITIEDNGSGFKLDEEKDGSHAGLETVKSRVNYLNGNISIDSEKDTGTTVMMEFLLNEET